MSKGWTTVKGSRQRVLTLKCSFCSKSYERYTAHIRGQKLLYCSVTCRSADPAYRAYMKLKQAESPKWKARDNTNEKNPNWRGGKTKGRDKLQASKAYKEWRKAVYERDGYKCIECHVVGNGKNLNADHIKPYALYPELVFDVENGRTLCIDCHKATDTYGWKLFNDIKWRKKCRV